MAQISHVYVNNIEVGSLPAEQYNAIVKQVKSTPWLYVRQGINTVWVAFCLAIWALRVTPWVWFIFFLFFSVAEKQAVIDFISTVKSANSAELVQLIKLGFAYSYPMAFIACFVAEGLKGKLTGYRNYFDDAISFKIRRLLEVPAEGPIDVLTLEEKEDE